MAAGAAAGGPGARGRTALLAAVANGHEAAVDALLAAGAEPDRAGAVGARPLAVACAGGFPSIARRLLRAGASQTGRDDEAWTPLMWAAYRGRSQCLEALLEDAAAAPPPLEAADRRGYTALMVAAAHAREACVEKLLRAGARPDAVAADGETAAKKAARNGHVGVAAAVRLWARREHPDVDQLRAQRLELLRRGDRHFPSLDTLRLCADYVAPAAGPRAGFFGESAAGDSSE